MRKIEFGELKLKNINEEAFYEKYMEQLEQSIKEATIFGAPVKQYEIFYLNILGGKIILLNKEYIQLGEDTGQELFFDYTIALKIYNLILDIMDGIEAEQNEFNELYREERMQKSKEIEELKKQDEKLFKQKQEEYNIIVNSAIYREYLKIKEENQELKQENEKLLEKQNNQLVKIENNVDFFQKWINKFTNKNSKKTGEKDD